MENYKYRLLENENIRTGHFNNNNSCSEFSRNSYVETSVLYPNSGYANNRKRLYVETSEPSPNSDSSKKHLPPFHIESLLSSEPRSRIINPCGPQDILHQVGNTVLYYDGVHSSVSNFIPHSSTVYGTPANASVANEINKSSVGMQTDADGSIIIVNEMNMDSAIINGDGGINETYFLPSSFEDYSSPSSITAISDSYNTTDYGEIEMSDIDTPCYANGTENDNSIVIKNDVVDDGEDTIITEQGLLQTSTSNGQDHQLEPLDFSSSSSILSDITASGGCINVDKHERVRKFRVKKSKINPAQGRRRRTAFSVEQLKFLEEQFIDGKYLSLTERHDMSLKLALPESQIKIWFQNRRAKWKRMKAGSRMNSKVVVPIPIHANKSFTQNQRSANNQSGLLPRVPVPHRPSPTNVRGSFSPPENSGAFHSVTGVLVRPQGQCKIFRNTQHSAFHSVLSTRCPSRLPTFPQMPRQFSPTVLQPLCMACIFNYQSLIQEQYQNFN